VKATPLLAVAVIALVLGAGQGAKGATQQCAPCLELEAFTIDGHYRESRFENGVLVLIGRLEVAAQVRARLHFGNVAPRRATWQSRPLSLPTGDFAERMDLPPTLLPGPYVLEVVTTLSDGVEQRTFDSVRIPAPPEGVVILAWATPDRSGFTHHPRIKGRPTQVWAYFRFASFGAAANWDEALGPVDRTGRPGDRRSAPQAEALRGRDVRPLRARPSGGAVELSSSRARNRRETGSLPDRLGDRPLVTKGPIFDRQGDNGRG
jgi:hypothetical protein